MVFEHNVKNILGIHIPTRKINCLRRVLDMATHDVRFKHVRFSKEKSGFNPELSLGRNIYCKQ
jgi:hypothetical protein